MEVIKLSNNKNANWGDTLELKQLDDGQWVYGVEFDGVGHGCIAKFGTYPTRQAAIEHFVAKYKPRILSRERDDPHCMFNWSRRDINDIVAKMDSLCGYGQMSIFDIEPS